MSGLSEDDRAQLEEVERGLQGMLERLDRALHLCEQLQAGQRTLFARLERLEAQLAPLERLVDNHLTDHFREERR